MSKRALLVETLRGLRRISDDTTETIQHVKAMLAKMEDKDCEMERGECSKRARLRTASEEEHHGYHTNNSNTGKDTTSTTTFLQSNHGGGLKGGGKATSTAQLQQEDKEERAITASTDGRQLNASVKPQQAKVKVKGPLAFPPQQQPQQQQQQQQQDKDVRMQFELRILDGVKNELPLLTKLSPPLQVEVLTNVASSVINLYWLLQVECSEHQTKWELATFIDEASSSIRTRSRTDFSESLLIPIDASTTHSSNSWIETLPDIQLRAEREVWDPRARACQAHRHRFHFRITLVDGQKNPVSLTAFSFPFRLMSCFATLDDSISDQVLKARRVVRHMGDDEIRDRTSVTSQSVIDEREHVVPQVVGIEPAEITLTGNADYSRIEISGKYFHQARVVRRDSDPPNEVQRQSFPPNSRVAGASIKVPRTSELMMLGVQNFDDPNLYSKEYQFLSFKLAPLSPLAYSPMNLPNFEQEDFSELSSIFEEDVAMPFVELHTPETNNFETKLDVLVETTVDVLPTAPVAMDKFLVYQHIVSGYTHTVSTMLQAVEFKKLIKLKLGMVPALLALLSENPCMVITCLTIHLAEQLEINQLEFKRSLEYITSPRDFPLQPRMLFDFLQNEIGIDVRTRFKKMACLLADSMVSDADSAMEDDSSEYSPNSDNCSTSDEDYEDEPAGRGHGGSRLRLSLKLDKQVTYPVKSTGLDGVCDWEGCLLCERDVPIMLQTQNPTWAAVMRVVFYSFVFIFPNCEFWMVRQAYKYIEDHWDKLCPGKNRNVAWRKQLQDALSHNRQYFVSGVDKFNQKGYWGLKQVIDPWAISDNDDQPKRAYHHQPRSRGRPPKSTSTVVRAHPRRESNSYIFKCLKQSTAQLPTPPQC